jgi:hypothetical protein
VGAFTLRALLRDDGREKVLLGEDPALTRPVWVWLRLAGDRPLSAGRRDLVRGTRPRWLAGGTEGCWDWDAFVAPGGCLLADAVRPNRRLSWAEARALLEQLAEELELATRDGTLPGYLGVGSVWVQPAGRPMLLDVSPRGGPAARDPLDLLRQTAMLALEDRVPGPDDPPRPIRAPVPGHAAALLDRLMGVGLPFADLTEARQTLAAAAEAPAEVDRPHRLLHLGLSLLGLAPGLAVLFLAGPGALVGMFTLAVMAQVAAENARDRNQERAIGAVTFQAGPSGPLDRATMAAVLAEVLQECEPLDEQVAEAKRERDRMLQSSSRFFRRAVEPLEGPYREAFARAVERDFGEGEEETEEPWRLPSDYALGALEMPRWMALGAATFLVWPLLWAVWAFLTRGGLTLRLAHLALVQGDGRPAARWRCAWRVLMVWAPVALLLLVSFFFDVYRVAVGATGEEVPWATRLTWLAWWEAALLVAAYVWMALRWPGRGPHDRLAGTWLVPR